MNNKPLFIGLVVALALSVALNVFAIAAGGTLLVGRERTEARIAAEQKPPRDRPYHAVVAQLDPAVRERVRDALRASALAAKPDFEEARSKRREAVALAGSSSFDAARVTALVEESTAAEMRGRARIEAESVRVLGTLDAADRVALAEILTRRGRIVVVHGSRREGHEGSPDRGAKRN